MNVARLNMVHADHAWHRKVIRSIKRLNETKGYCVASECTLRRGAGGGAARGRGRPGRRAAAAAGLPPEDDRLFLSPPTWD